MRRKSSSEREEHDAILETYMHALGMLGELAETPLGQHALETQFPDEARA